MTEADLLRAVVELATFRGWRVHHTRPARTAGGWRTPIVGHVGAPDLLLARDGRALHAELKSATGRLGPGQDDWAHAIGDTYRLWRPSDMPRIAEELR